MSTYHNHIFNRLDQHRELFLKYKGPGNPELKQGTIYHARYSPRFNTWLINGVDANISIPKDSTYWEIVPDPDAYHTKMATKYFANTLDIRQTYTIKRNVSTGNRVKEGKHYALFYSDSEWKIIDELGKTFSPQIQLYTRWWEFVEPAECTDRVLDNPVPQQEETQPMKLTIENVTLVNGKNTNDLSDDCLVGLIEEEQKNIERLVATGLQEKSKAIKSRLAQHEANIAKLIELMDSRCTEV